EHAPPGRPLGPQQAVPQQYIVQVVASQANEAGVRPVFSGLTRRDQEVWSDATANTLWTAGIRPDDVVAHLADLPAIADGWPYADGLRRLGATVAWLGGLAPEHVLAQISALQVTALVTTTSTAVRLAEEAFTAVPPDQPRVPRLLVGGEPGLDRPDIRARIADGWGATHVRETMGLAEVMAGMWSACSDEGGMHFNAAKYVIVELVDPATDAHVPLSDGARGEAVYTTFDRDATPVLRFRSGELLEVTATRCACGRTSPRVRCLGRNAARAAGEPETALVGVHPLPEQRNGGAARVRA
ncbi:MAG TPA: hypothetical protein VOB72_06590, partial [Candidatus Dormibacteraeota bacterium]|nr:hypothetical protein [Candidatus Dormibacteraeota bacterium]